MKTLKIIPPSLPSGLTVVNTSWFVNTNDTFTGTILLEDLNNTVKLFEYPLSFTISGVAYAKVVMTLSNGNTETSDIIQLSKYNDNKPEALFVFAPVITYDISQIRKNMIVQITPPKMFYYTSAHVSTSWRLVDSSGTPFYDRTRDEDNLLSLTIPERIYNSKEAFTIEAVYNFVDTSIDVVGRENVFLRTHNSDVALSRSTVSSLTDTTITVLGLDYDVAKVDLTYTIGNVTSKTITVQRGLQETFTIAATEAANGLVVTVDMLMYTTNGNYNRTVTLDVIAFDTAKVKLLTSQVIVEEVSKGLATIEAGNQTYPIVNSVVRALTQTEEVSYSIANNGLVETARIPKLYNSYFMSSDQQLYARDLNTIHRLDPLTLNITSTFFTPLPQPINGVGISDYKGSVFLMNNANQEYEIDDVSLVNLGVRNKPYDFYIRITNTMTFIGSVVGDYLIEGGTPRSLPGTYLRVDYIRTSKGVIAVAIGQTVVDVYYINSTSHTLKSSVVIADQAATIVAYDISTNKIFVIH